MVETIINKEANNVSTNIPVNPRIIELVGLAGVGKTTTSQRLHQLSKRILIINHPYFRKVTDLPFFIWNTILMIPIFAGYYFTKNGDRYFTLREMAWMVILNGWWRVLKKKETKKNMIFLLDQGPISLMAELWGFGPKYLRRSVGEKWFSRILDNWAGTLEALVCMDTDDFTLFNRVRAREKWHLIKEKNDDEAYIFNQKFRVIYQTLVEQLTQRNPAIFVINIDTGRGTLEETVPKIASLLQLDSAQK